MEKQGLIAQKTLAVNRNRDPIIGPRVSPVAADVTGIPAFHVAVSNNAAVLHDLGAARLPSIPTPSTDDSPKMVIDGIRMRRVVFGVIQ